MDDIIPFQPAGSIQWVEPTLAPDMTLIDDIVEGLKTAIWPSHRNYPGYFWLGAEAE